MANRGLPPLFGAPWEREPGEQRYIDTYSLMSGRPEINVDAVRRLLLEAREPLDNLFDDFRRRKEFQRAAAMTARILESIEEFDMYITSGGEE